MRRAAGFADLPRRGSDSKLVAWLDVTPRWTVVIALIIGCSDLIVVGHQPYWWLAVISTCGLLIGQLRKQIWTSLLLSCLPLLVGQYATMRLSAQKETNIATLFPHAFVFISGDLNDEWTTKDGRQYYLLSAKKAVACGSGVVAQPVSGGVALSVKERTGDESKGLRVGQSVVVRGKVCLPRAALYPWDFNESSYLHRRGADCRMNLSITAIQQLPDDRTAFAARALDAAFAAVRSRMCELHRSVLGAANGDLLSSMVIGNRAVQVGEEISLSFRNLGLSHILAASGFNLTVVIASVWWLLRWLWRSPMFLNTASFAAMFFYVGLAGLSPSVQRAAIMCCIVLGSRCFYRSAYLPATLSLALCLTIIVDPLSMLDVGLQLSYLATAGLVAGASSFSAALKKQFERIPGWLCESIAVVLVAQCSVLPLQLLYFWQIGLFFLPANLLVSPLVPLITIFGFASSASGMVAILPFQELARLMDLLVAWPLKLMLTIVQWLGQFEWARINTGPPSIAAVLIYYLSLILWFMDLSRVKQAGASQDKETDQQPVGGSPCYGTIAIIAAIVLLFWRPPLPPLTVVCFAQGCVVIDQKHNAVSIGMVNEVALNRTMAYFAARAVPPQQCELNVTEKDGSCVVDHVPSASRIIVVAPGAQSSGASFFALLDAGGTNTCVIERRQLFFGQPPHLVSRKIRSSLVLVRSSAGDGFKIWSPSGSP